MKKITVSKAKRLAWKAFSQYIRARDCKESSEYGMLGNCYTCGSRYEFEQLQSGHFQPGRFPIYLFDEKQVHAQCYNCNINLKGNWPRYYEHMVKDYGQKEVNKMIAQRNNFKQFKVFELLEIEKKYKELYELVKEG